MPITYPVVAGDWCQRCGRVFQTGDQTIAVIGTLDPPIAQAVCRRCTHLEVDTHIVGMSVYISSVRAGAVSETGPPGLILTTMPGYGGWSVAISECSDGRWRVGQKRNHIEGWTRHDVRQMGVRAPLGAYDPKSQAYANELAAQEFPTWFTARVLRRIYARINCDTCLIWDGQHSPDAQSYVKFVADWSQLMQMVPHDSTVM